MDTRIVQFFSRSATKDDLGINFGNWRNYLSNFQEPSGRTLIIPDPTINKDTADSNIIYRHYYTVEHYFQACKYLLATENPEFFLNFLIKIWKGILIETLLLPKELGLNPT